MMSTVRLVDRDGLIFCEESVVLCLHRYTDDQRSNDLGDGYIRVRMPPGTRPPRRSVIEDTPYYTNGAAIVDIALPDGREHVWGCGNSFMNDDIRLHPDDLTTAIASLPEAP